MIPKEIYEIKIEEKKSEYQIGKLTDKQKMDFEQLMRKNKDIFAKDRDDLGKTGLVKHTIDTGDAKPIKQRAYQTSQKEKQVINEEVKRMLKQGIIRKSNSPWTSPVVLVRKKDGKYRFCIDYRKLNSITKKDNHPLPRIDDMLEMFRGSQWFTTLDLASGYWQVEMDEKDREKTAFITYDGIYEFNVMPFGLCNAPATFQRLMHTVLEDLIFKKAPVYIDDINVHSKIFEQHLKDLEQVFMKIRKAKLKLKLGKCHFCYPEIKFLGYIVGKDGIKTDQEKIEKVKNFPRPTNITELKSFIGLASYYRRFIEGFSKISKPLTELQEGISFTKNKMINKMIKKKNIEENWTDKQEKCFLELKKRLTEAPVLMYPDFDKPFKLYTDASGKALGAVLQQKGIDEKEHVIAYASKSLTKAEQNYSTTELECLAVVWAIEKFHHYLMGEKFTVVTDHYALKWLRTQPIKGRIGRWILKLQAYDFEVEYKEGKRHSNADALSRINYIKD